jgi:uncharacterized protein YjbI with pentapeptide repeats
MADRWPSCDQEGCAGVADRGTSCLAHAGANVRNATLEQFSKSGDLDVRGVTISAALLRQILDAAPPNPNGNQTFSAVQFEEATFESEARFDGATFKGYPRFAGATFERSAVFAGATFESDAEFSGTTFKGPAEFGRATLKGTTGFVGATFEGTVMFSGATFESTASFPRATFERSAEFRQTTFKGYAGFVGATFEDFAGFAGATFGGKADFEGSTFGDFAGFEKVPFKGFANFEGAAFKGYARFEEATFENDIMLEGATFERSAEFRKVTFEGAAWFDGTTFKVDAGFEKVTFKADVPVLGLTTVGGRLDLDGAQFASAVRIETEASELTCRRGRFPGGVRFDVRRAVVRLDDSDLSMPSLLTGPPVSSPAGAVGRPRLLSLQGANVAGLALGNVSLADCWFAEAHNLDKLRIEAGTTFGRSPVPSVWDHRQVIAEEAAWRAARVRPGRWNPPEWPYFDKPEVLSPGAVAVLYRALRKSREDAKDEPGAADFYYGEMEMRRHDRGTGDAIRWRGHAIPILLWAYWLVSGYGLRAARSIAALAVVTALFATAFYFIGFTIPPEPASYWTSLLYAFRSTVSLTDSQVTLTAWGSFFQALLRITGPVLLGLTLLALRNRVKR